MMQYIWDGIVDESNSGQANYGLAKAGIVGLSKVIAKVRMS